MTRLLSLLIFALLAAPGLSQSHCEPQPPLVIDIDYIIEGTASKDGYALPMPQVSLYSGRKLVRRVLADWQGEFTLDRLPLGVYQLHIQGLGSFPVKVVQTNPLKQGRHYGFGLHQGCLYVGFNTN